MINGILFLETGEFQQLGELKSGRQIISSMHTVMQQLIEQERNAILNGLTTEELEHIIAQRRDTSNRDE